MQGHSSKAESMLTEGPERGRESEGGKSKMSQPHPGENVLVLGCLLYSSLWARIRAQSHLIVAAGHAEERTDTPSKSENRLIS